MKIKKKERKEGRIGKGREGKGREKREEEKMEGGTRINSQMPGWSQSSSFISTLKQQ